MTLPARYGAPCAMVASLAAAPAQGAAHPWTLFASGAGSELILNAGELDNVGPGATLTLSPANGGRDFKARVLRSDPEVSELEPDPDQNLDSGPGPFSARILAPAPVFTLTTALDLTAATPGAARRFEAVMKQVAAEGGARDWPVTFGGDPSSADVVLELMGDRLVFRPSGEPRVAGSHPSALIVDADFSAQRLGRALSAVARTENLLRIARSTPLRTRGATLQTQVWKASLKSGKGCEELPFYPTRPPSEIEPLDRNQDAPLNVVDCDVIYVKATNTSGTPVVVNSFYIARDFAVQEVGRSHAGDTLAPDQSALIVSPVTTNGEPSGVEAILLMVTAITGQYELGESLGDIPPPADLSHLAHPGLSSLPGAILVDEPATQAPSRQRSVRREPAAGQFDDMGAVIIPIISTPG